MKSIFKMTARTIRTFFRRYMALLLIVALSAGFFSGLKITTDAMINTGDNYLSEQNFYDFRIFSTLGFTADDIDELENIDGIKSAEGSYSVDALIEQKDSVVPCKLIALPESVNQISLVSGRMPSAENECAADDERYSEDDIGTLISISNENSDSTLEQLNTTEYTIVGLVNSPLYIGLDRGTTDIGNGSVSGFIYIMPESFTSDVYTEASLVLNETAFIYSDEYDNIIDKYESEVTALTEQLADERYQSIFEENSLSPKAALQMGIEEPEIYVLTRDENAGYASFENDTGIIGGVANIFPIFFIMISILVCITTMTRMVDEERTQIGVLKAMGFSDSTIMSKYLLYAGSATLIGWVIGFFLCTWGLPKIFWFAYNEIYDFASIDYLFNSKLAALTLIISLFFILGSTYLSCRRELKSVPASLIRPKAAKKGKRVFLERITPIWRKFSFLQKITVRNMFRYKQRMFMMLVGIGCCAGLIVTAFGIRDSMINVGELQYDTIQKYDIEASFDVGELDSVTDSVSVIDGIEGYTAMFSDYVELSSEETMNSVNLLSFDDENSAEGYWDFHSDSDTVNFPQSGEAIISPKIAEKLSLSVGDSVTIRTDSMETGIVTISGIFDNHIYDYIVISADTYNELFGAYDNNTLLIAASEDSEAVLKELTKIEQITSVSQLDLTEKNVSDALGCLNYIIWLVIFFSGALAFIVIFNLTNINIAERSREIATVQVLGFYPKETESYVLKENLILSVIASLLGLPLGKLFHTTVMSMVRIDMINFNNHVEPISYIAAFICSILFAVIVNQFMKRNIAKINMAESLKSVE